MISRIACSSSVDEQCYQQVTTVWLHQSICEGMEHISCETRYSSSFLSLWATSNTPRSRYQQNAESHMSLRLSGFERRIRVSEGLGVLCKVDRPAVG